MCLYPKRYVNKKYTPTKKNGGIVPDLPVIGVDAHGFPIYDERVATIEIPCGQCKECREKKAREWTCRLMEELPCHEYKYMITLTFTNEDLKQIMAKSRLTECNAVAEYALRHCLERWRKDHKKSLRHWCVTELGHENTERIHIHGIFFPDEPLEFTDKKEANNGYYSYKWKYWKYGRVNVGDYVNERTVNYIAKYMTKIDTDHKGYIGQVLCSPGIGKAFLDKEIAKQYKYKPKESKDYYRLKNGAKMALTTYYRNKLYNEEERELMWRESMDIDEKVIMGTKYEMERTPGEAIEGVYTKQKEVNTFLGYGSDSREWRKREYNITKRMLQASQARQDLFEKFKKSAGSAEKMYEIMQKYLENSK